MQLFGSIFISLLTLSLGSLKTIHHVPCNDRTASCRCNQDTDACEFDFEVSNLQTFAKYEVKDGNVYELNGFIHYINGSGQLVSYDGNVYGAGYTEAATVDGKTYRMFSSINGRMPGPTLIVTEGQTIIVNVRNNMKNQDLTIHWHGILQRNTPWMDGSPYVTQCPITANAVFKYIFVADHAGTFWYHSHVEAQRGDGIQGALVILGRDVDASYLDLPERHTINLQDWFAQPFMDVFTTQHSVEETFYPRDVGELPVPNRDVYTPTLLPDGSTHGIIPYFSGLINGKGRHRDVPYSKSILATFRVDYGRRYRFRMVGEQSLFAYKVSVDQHKLTVIATDGQDIKPIREVDYVIIQSGERYDFLLNADQDPTEYYWIRAETLEVDTTGNGPPFRSLGNKVEAVLYYSIRGEPSPTDYARISSSPPSCTASSPCIAVNCPFKSFHPSYHIECINIGSFKLLRQSPITEIPSNIPSLGQEYFLNFGYSGPPTSGLKLRDNINGKMFKSPPAPVLIASQRKTLDLPSLLCPTQPYTCEEGCTCLHMLTIPYNKTVQMIWANFGGESHPVHMHGHSFFVVATGYGGYDKKTGFTITTSPDLSCRKDECDNTSFSEEQCATLHWRSGHKPSIRVNPYTLRKDTVIIPSGGYVVIEFLSSNPGFWLLHCHIEPHMMEGMAMVLDIAEEWQNPAPPGMPTCGDFKLSLDAFYEKLVHNPVTTGYA